MVDSCAMSDVPPVRSPTRPVSGYEFASRVLSRFPEDGVQMLLDFAGCESDWLEKKAGVYPWGKDEDVLKLREQGEAIFTRDYPCLEQKLCRTIAEAIVALHNLRGGVVFIGIEDTKENRVVPLRENDPEGFLEKDVDNYIRNAVDPRLWPKDALFCEKDGNRRLVAPVPDKDAVFRAECVQFKGEPILAVLVHERTPGSMPLSFSVEPKIGAARTEVVYRSPGSKGCVARLSVTNDNRLRDFLEIIRPKSLSNFDLADQAARWGISFPVAEPPPLPRPTKPPRFSFLPGAAAVAAFAAGAFLLVSFVVVLFLAFSDDEEDEGDEVADIRPVPATIPSAPVSVPAAPVAKPEPVPRERSGTTAVPTSVVPRPDASGFEPAVPEAVEWDDEDRFAARRDAAVQCRKFADWLSWCTNGLTRPVADAKGVVRIREGEIFATADIAGTPGVRKVLLDGGELLFSRRLDELLHFHREATNVASRAERGIATDDEVRDSPAERMRSRLSREDDRPFEIPIEIGPSGGWITRKRFEFPVRGPIESVVKSRLSASPDGPGPTVATGIRFPPLEDSAIYSILFGSYSIWTDPDPQKTGARLLYRHGSRGRDLRDMESLLFPLGRISAIMPPSETGNNRHSSHRRMCLSEMKSWLRGLLSNLVDGTPDESGDIVVSGLKSFLTGDIPEDGSAKRIVLRRGTIIFGPSREELRSILAKLEAALANARDEDDLPPDGSLFPPPARIRKLSLPILVEMPGGTIKNDPDFTEEAWLLSPVSNVFGERPQLCIVGGIFVDPHAFSRKINVFGSSDKPIDQAEQSDSLLWLCDFSGPFPRRLSQLGENARDNRIPSSRRFAGPSDTSTLQPNTDWE